METKRIVKDCITGEEFLEDLEPELLAEMAQEAARLASLPTEEELAALAAAKEKTKAALLARLGITEEEAQLLLGGN